MHPAPTSSTAREAQASRRIGASSWGNRTARAFTFVEILAALFFLAILIPAIMGAITISTKAGETAEREAIAAELAQNKLSELSLDDAWMSADMSGNFGDDWPGLHWEAEHATWDYDAMELLTVRAYYTVRGREEKVQLSTLVGTGTAATSATATSISSSSSSSSSTKRSGTSKK